MKLGKGEREGTRRRAMRGKRLLQAGVKIMLAAMLCAAQIAMAQQSQRQTALMLEQQGRVGEAEAAWHTHLKAHHGCAEANAHLGLLEARQGHYKEAVPYYRRALAKSPNVPGLRLDLGLALFKGGDLRGAQTEFLRELKQAPAGSAEVQRLGILVGMTHYGLGQYADAVPYLKKAAEADPNNLKLRLALAHSCLWSKQYQCVLDTYHQILLLNAESAEADMLAGEALDYMKNFQGAIEQFRAAVKANPREPEAHFGLGYLLWTQRQYPEAAKEFAAELANDPNHAQSMTYLGDIELQMGNTDKAQPLLERAVKLGPKIELAHLDLGVLYEGQKKREDALRELKIAEGLSPDDTNVHWRLGRLYHVMGRKAEAKVEFDKAASLHKAENEALFNKMNGQAATQKPESSADGTEGKK